MLFELARTDVDLTVLMRDTKDGSKYMYPPDLQGDKFGNEFVIYRVTSNKYVVLFGQSGAQ